MKIIKKINTSAAIALDSKGREIVVLGKGIGFPPVPYELEDLSKIERTFYDVEPEYRGVIANIPENIIEVAAKINELAEEELDMELSPNFPFTLADHLNFAVERLRSGIDLTVAISYDIQYLYQREYSLGKKALQMMNDEAGIMLPESEAVNIALHLINSEKGTNNATKVLRDARIVSEVDRIIEDNMKMKMDKGSYEYARYVKHLMYLVNRFESKEESEVKNGMMLKTLAREYPDIYECALRITRYFQGTWGWNCSKDETLYLMLHINRLLN
ncbi:MAG: PRD domain-containing protein [Erysipelotrichaceae bacterium]|nr:PRD domain-containing protein [Erysipelotrichaceae bacterium]MBR6233414.1 PRD domain-containing protein [Erysipelotrichaceae bacterium]